MNVDGVDPTVLEPWRLLEPSAGIAAGAVSSEGGYAAPQGRHTAEGESPSNPVGVSRAIQFGGTSIYEFDAESPIGEHVEESPTPLAIPGPADSCLGGGPVSTDRHTTNMADGRRTPSDGGCASGTSHPTALPLRRHKLPTPHLALWPTEVHVVMRGKVCEKGCNFLATQTPLVATCKNKVCISNICHYLHFWKHTDFQNKDIQSPKYSVVLHLDHCIPVCVGGGGAAYFSLPFVRG